MKIPHVRGCAVALAFPLAFVASAAAAAITGAEPTREAVVDLTGGA